MVATRQVQLHAEPGLMGPTAEIVYAPTKARQVPCTGAGGLMPLPCVSGFTETWLFSDFTDGGGTSGTRRMAGAIPAGALFLYAKVLVPAGFAGDTSAVIILGDGTTTDRYGLATGSAPSVFATAATGIEIGNPSGAVLQIASVSPVITITSGSDFTAVNAGSVTVSFFYLVTV